MAQQSERVAGGAPNTATAPSAAAGGGQPTTAEGQEGEGGEPQDKVEDDCDEPTPEVTVEKTDSAPYMPTVDSLTQAGEQNIIHAGKQMHTEHLQYSHNHLPFTNRTQRNRLCLGPTSFFCLLWGV